MGDTLDRRAELFVRTLAPVGAWRYQESVLERLVTLRREGRLGALDLTVWGDAIPLEGASSQVGTGAVLAERVRSFFHWCADRETSLEPFFSWSAVESSITGESFERVVPPQCCLAVYDGDDLEAVYPCEVDGTTWSLEDGLRTLESRAAGAGIGGPQVG